MEKRGALFYIIDAFVAASIITLTIAVIFSSTLNKQVPEQAENELGFYLDYLQLTAITNAPSSTAKNLLDTGVISSRSLTILEAAIELEDQGLGGTGPGDDAWDMLEEISEAILEDQFGVRVIFDPEGSDEKELFRKDSGSGRTEAEARTLFVKKAIVRFEKPFVVTTTTQTINLIDPPDTGDNKCAALGAAYKCLYVDNSGDYNTVKCSDSTAGVDVRCRTIAMRSSLTANIEVRLWS